MKKVLIITCVLALLAMGAAMADPWSIWIGGSNPSGASQALISSATVGYGPDSEAPSTPAGVYAGFNDANGAIGVDADQVNATPGTPTVWDAYMGSYKYTPSSMNLNVGVSGAYAGVPVLSDGTYNYAYTLSLVDNKGKNTYANGTTWDLTSLIAGVTPGTIDSVQILTITNLPTILANPGSTIYTAGYHFQLTQTATLIPVPEPSSLLALGTGLVGLAGFVIRRRRAQISKAKNRLLTQPWLLTAES